MVLACVKKEMQLRRDRLPGLWKIILYLNLKCVLELEGVRWCLGKWR